MSLLQEEKSYVSLGDDKWGKIVVNKDGSEIGGGGGGGASTIADGADVTQGAVADAANTTGTTGTISGKLRGLITILADVWNGTLHVLKIQEQYAPGYEDNVANIAKTEQQVEYTAPITASTLIKSGSGRWFGFIVNSHTSGTIKAWDNTSGATTVIMDTVTLAAGPQFWVFPVGIKFTTGLYITIGGTASITPLWK